MQALQTPLQHLVDELRYLAEADEVRALHVRTDDALRSLTLEHIAAEEFYPGQRRVHLVVGAPGQGDGGASDGHGAEGDRHGGNWRGDDWQAATQMLLGEVELARDALAQLDPPVLLPPLRAEASQPASLSTFAAALEELSRALPEPLTGLVVALNPWGLTDAAAWNRDLDALLRTPSLHAVKWVVVDDPEAASRALLYDLGDAGLQAEVCFDEQGARDELAAQGAMTEQALAQQHAALNGTAPNAAPSPAMLAGGAGPASPPPPRVDAPAAMDPESLAAQLDAAGASAEAVAATSQPAAMHRLQLDIAAAGAALQQQDFAAAIARYNGAAATATDLGLVKESLVLRLSAAAAMLQGKAARHGAAAFESVATDALAQEPPLADIAVQARFGEAAALLLPAPNKRGPQREAAARYAEAGRLAASHDQTLLGVEGFRMAGQLLVESGATEDGARAYREALAVAEGIDTEQLPLTGAADIARTLAVLCDNHGLGAQAASLREQAQRIDDGALAQAERALAEQRTAESEGELRPEDEGAFNTDAANEGAADSETTAAGEVP